jgi:hypothetical protein
MTSTLIHHENSLNFGSPHPRAGAIEPSKDFVGETIAVWQKHTERNLTREDGREIIANMTGFFRALQDWRQAERRPKARRPTALR